MFKSETCLIGRGQLFDLPDGHIGPGHAEQLRDTDLEERGHHH